MPPPSPLYWVEVQDGRNLGNWRVLALTDEGPAFSPVLLFPPRLYFVSVEDALCAASAINTMPERSCTIWRQRISRVGDYSALSVDRVFSTLLPAQRRIFFTPDGSTPGSADAPGDPSADPPDD